MPWISAAVAVGGSLLSGAMADDAAGDASDDAVKSTEAATAEQRRQYDLNRADQAQYMQTGNLANARLAYLMGLSPTSAASGQGYNKTADQLRQELLGRYTSTQPGAGGQYVQTLIRGSGADDGTWYEPRWQEGVATSQVDESGLNAAIQEAMAQQDRDRQAAASAAGNDPNYGSLSRRFTMADRDADPVYQSGLQFGLNEGTGALNARAIQQGGYDSGAALKALTRFANDYGTTKAEGSYNRFNTDQTNQFNRLSGLSGTGQTSTGQVATAGTNMANNISNLTTDAGTARAAGIVGSGNAWSNAIGNVANTGANYFRNLLTRPYDSNTTVPMQPGGGY